ncbi:MAG: hypothetical protein LC792_24295, partial [Actinobacteria bacterium]|nr:hypothetical protein [Actinomycetota bacterium]
PPGTGPRRRLRRRSAPRIWPVSRGPGRFRRLGRAPPGARARISLPRSVRSLRPPGRARPGPSS